MNDLFLEPYDEEKHARFLAKREAMWAAIEPPEALKPCPFCKGAARLSAKDHAFGGYSVDGGHCRREYMIRAICNKCHARGGSVTTGWVTSMYDSYKRRALHVSEIDAEVFARAERNAAHIWNTRFDIDGEGSGKQ